MRWVSVAWRRMLRLTHRRRTASLETRMCLDRISACYVKSVQITISFRLRISRFPKGQAKTWQFHNVSQCVCVFLRYSLNNVADFHENWRNFSAMKFRNSQIPKQIPGNMATIQNLRVWRNNINIESEIQKYLIAIHISKQPLHLLLRRHLV
jgi:hypothetical protein